jgi:uncharacterized short protein YbdD (DUF466 family)
MTIVKRLRPAFGLLWTWLRAVSGDSAYEEHRRRAGAAAMGPQAFYLDRLRRRYDPGPNRCC